MGDTICQLRISEGQLRLGPRVREDVDPVACPLPATTCVGTLFSEGSLNTPRTASRRFPSSTPFLL